MDTEHHQVAHHVELHATIVLYADLMNLTALVGTPADGVGLTLEHDEVVWERYIVIPVVDDERPLVGEVQRSGVIPNNRRDVAVAHLLANHLLEVLFVL